MERKNNDEKVMKAYEHPDWCRCAFCSMGRFFVEKEEDENEEQREENDE